MQNWRRVKLLLLVVILMVSTVIVSVVRFTSSNHAIQSRVVVNVSKLNTTHPEDALENKDKQQHPESALENKDKLHLVVMFYNLLDVDWRAKHFKFSSEKWEERMGEISECIRRNLNNSMVSSVHYLYHNITTMNAYLDGLNLPHREKLFVHEANATTVADFMRFASDNLQGRVVMFLNSDGFLGDGFEKLDFPYLRNNRLVYALTRHWVACKGGGSCHDGDIYQGSHDAYVFHLKEKLPEPFFAEINTDPSHYGIESVIMGAFHHVLKYTLRNPCKILNLMHNHCSGVRPGDSLSLRLARRPHDTLAGFSGLYI